MHSVQRPSGKNAVARTVTIIGGIWLLASLAACQTTTTTVPIYAGNELYAANCSSCHGNYGEGDGPVSAALNIPMQDLRYLAERNCGVFPRGLVAKIIDGRE